MDNSGSSVQNVQPVAGPSTQTTHDQITQNQTDAPTQQEDEEESSEEEDNSDDDCEGDEGTCLFRLSYFLTRKSVENMFIYIYIYIYIIVWRLNERERNEEEHSEILFKAYR